MANENRIKTILDFVKGDQSGVKAIKDAEKAEKQLAGAIADGNQAATAEVKKLTAEQEKFNAALKDAEKASKIDALTKQYGELARSQEDAEKAANDLLTKLKEIGATDSEIESAAQQFQQFKSGGAINKDTFGDSSSGLSGLAGAANATGLGGAGSALQLGADITGAAEQLPKLGASVVQFAAGLGPAGLAVTAVAAAVGLAVASIIASQADLNAQISAGIKANADIERQIASGLTVDDAKAKIEELNRQREAELQIIEKEKESREQAASVAKEQFGILGGAAVAFVNATSSAEETSAEVQKEAEENARKYAAEIDRLNQAIANGELVQNTAAVTFENLGAGLNSAVPGGLNFATAIDSISGSLGITDSTLNQVTGGLNTFVTGGLGALNTGLQSGLSALTAISEAEKAREAILQQAADAINKAAAAEDALNAKRAQSDQRAAEDAGIAAKRAGDAQAAALIEAKRAETEKLTQIAEQGAQKVADLQQQLAEGTDKAYQQIADENAAFQDQALKEQEDFDRAQKRARRDYQKEIERINRDEQQGILDGLLNMDFGAVLSAQQNADQQAADAKDAFKTGKGDAQEDFQIQQEREAEAHAAKIADIAAELVEFQNSTAQKIAATQAETAATIAAQQAAFDDQMAKEAAKKALTDQYAAEDAALKAKRLAEDRAAEDAAAQVKLDADLARITEKADAETAAQVKLLEVVSQADTGLSGLLAKAQQLAQSAASSVGSKGVNPSPGSVTIPQFANEGIVPRDGIYRAGDVGAGEREAVVRFKESEGLGASLSRRTGGNGGGGVTIMPGAVQVNATVGDIATASAVRGMITDAGNQLIDMVIQAQQTSITDARGLKGAKV